MQEITAKLQNSISAALNEQFNFSLSAEKVSFNQVKPGFKGDITFVIFPFVKLIGKSPKEIGEGIGNYVSNALEEVASFEVVQGFVNFSFTQSFWLQTLKQVAATPNFGSLPKNGEKVMVEYSSPNTNKPLHLGHLRNNFLGHSLSNILDKAGYEVIMATLVNDRGIHICKSMVAYEAVGNNATPSSMDMKGDHFVGYFYVQYSKLFKQQVEDLIAAGMEKEKAEMEAPIYKAAQDSLRKWETGDEQTLALWRRMNGWVYEGFAATYHRIGVSFDKTYYESDTYILGKDIIEEGLAKGVFYKKPDNSVWIDLTADGLDEKLVLRGDGTSVYITQDLGTADLKYEDFKLNKSIYVVGNEQDYHFKVLFLILQKLGRPYADGLYHASYGMVELPDGKMKSREGTTVDADNLLDEMKTTAQQKMEEAVKGGDVPADEKEALLDMIGLGAIKYFLLKVEPTKKILFNPQQSIELQGNTGAAIQYCHARICSIKRNAADRGIALSFPDAYLPENEELELARLLVQLPEKVREAAATYNPSLLANYAYEITRAYNSFFANLSIFKAENEVAMQFRVALSSITGFVIAEAMGLLGIGVPERM